MTSSALDLIARESVVGLLLASGFGRRFDAGGRRNKLLARLPDGQTIVSASARTLCSVLEHVAVVVPSRSALLEAALSDLPVRLIRNARAKDGIGASIAAGVAALRADFPTARGWLIALGDMPFVLPATIRAVTAALIDDGGRPLTIVAPAFRGVRGHPVGFARGLDDALATLDGDVGAQALVQRHGMRLIPCDDAGVLRDIDTPDDLSRAGASPSGRRPSEPPRS